MIQTVRVLAAFALSAISLAALAAEERVKSGVQAGDSIAAIFEPLNVTGPFAGEHHCLVCENGANPVAMIFAREPSDMLVALLTKIDAATAANANQELGSFVVFLSDQENLADRLNQIAKQHSLQHIILTIGEPQGPDGFDVAQEADVTVVLYREFQVKANHAFKTGQLSEESIAKILADVPKILTK